MSKGTQQPDLRQITQMMKPLIESLDPKSKEQMGAMIDGMTGAFIKTMDPKIQPQLRQHINETTKDLLQSNVTGPSSGSHEPHRALPPPQQFREPKNETDYEVLDPNEKVDPFNPRTKDLIINLETKLEDLYSGAEKKIAITRERIKKDPKSGKDVITEEKKKIHVNIVKGMRDEQVIRYSKQASERFGYDTGDIIIILKQNGHPTFERNHDNLFITKDISLYETYAAAEGLINIAIQTLDFTYLRLDAKGVPLHENNGLRKVEGLGMPIYKPEAGPQGGPPKTHGDLYIRFNLVLPKSFPVQIINGFKKICPPIDKDIIYNDGTSGGLDPKMHKIKNVVMNELTEEDIKDLDEYSDEYSDSDEETDEYDDDDE